jgi:hypothetical protein
MLLPFPAVRVARHGRAVSPALPGVACAWLPVRRDRCSQRGARRAAAGSTRPRSRPLVQRRGAWPVARMPAAQRTQRDSPFRVPPQPGATLNPKHAPSGASVR